MLHMTKLLLITIFLIGINTTKGWCSPKKQPCPLSPQSTPVAKVEHEGKCSGDTIWFFDKSTITDGTITNIKIDFGDQHDTYIPRNGKVYHIYKSAGDYNIQVTAFSDDGTADTFNKTITVSPKPGLQFEYDPSTKIYRGQEVKITAIGSFNSILWNTGSEEESITVNKKGIYTAQIIDPEGCKNTASTAEIEVSDIPIAEGFDIKIANNILTPNDDGINDALVVLNISTYQNPITITIYDIWGKKVYENSSYDNNWTGEELEAGTYYYHVLSIGKQGKTGYIDLIK